MAKKNLGIRKLKTDWKTFLDDIRQKENRHKTTPHVRDLLDSFSIVPEEYEDEIPTTAQKNYLIKLLEFLTTVTKPTDHEKTSEKRDYLIIEAVAEFIERTNGLPSADRVRNVFISMRNQRNADPNAKKPRLVPKITILNAKNIKSWEAYEDGKFYDLKEITKKRQEAKNK